jgi:hypothetical protein
MPIPERLHVRIRNELATVRLGKPHLDRGPLFRREPLDTRARVLHGLEHARNILLALPRPGFHALQNVFKRLDHGRTLPQTTPVLTYRLK